MMVVVVLPNRPRRRSSSNRSLFIVVVIEDGIYLSNETLKTLNEISKKLDIVL